MRIKLFAIAAILFMFAGPAHAGQIVDHVYAGANGAWLNGAGSAFPADIEAGGSASASLSPHLSAVGEGFYGFSHSYFRWSGGVRATVTDVTNKNLSMGLGIRYRGGSIRAVRPNEWAPDVSVGWRPDPVRWPNVLVGGDAGYGLQSNRMLVTLGLRYNVPLK